MADQKTEKKTTPESTRRFRLTLAALKAVEEAPDHEVQTAIGEFDTFRELYIAAKLREVDARNPPAAQFDYSKFKDTVAKEITGAVQSGVSGSAIKAHD